MEEWREGENHVCHATLTYASIQNAFRVSWKLRYAIIFHLRNHAKTKQVNSPWMM